MNENNGNQVSNNFGMTDKVKEELSNLAKQIKSGELNNDEFSQAITNDVAMAIINLAKAVEEGSIDDKQLAGYLAIIVKRLRRDRDEKRKFKQKRKQKTILDVIMDRLMRSVAREAVNRKNNLKQAEKPGYFVQQMINDLDGAIFKLVNDSRLDTDINSIRLIEDTIAVTQKVAALSGKVSSSVKGMSMRLIQARAAVSGQALDSNISNLSSLKEGVAFESWEEAHRVDFNHGGGVDVKSESQKIDNKEMIKKFKVKENSVNMPSGPDNVPITESAKKQKERENSEWLNYQAILHKK